MCFGEFDGASFAQYSKFRLYRIRIDENDQYRAQTDFELQVCPYEFRCETNKIRRLIKSLSCASEAAWIL